MKIFWPRLFGWIDDVAWVFLLAAAPFLLFPSPTRSLALLAIPALWGIALLAGRMPILPTPLNVCLLVLSLMVAVSLYATYDIAVSLPKISGVVLGVAVYFWIVRQSGQRNGWGISLAAFLLAGLSIAAMGLLGTVWTTEKFPWMAALTKTFPKLLTGLPGAAEGIHPNELAGALLWVIPVGLLLAGTLVFRRTKPVAPRPLLAARALPWLLVPGMAFLVGTLFLTQSRGSYLALATTFALLLFLALPKRGRIGLSVLAGIGLLAAAGWLYTHPSLHWLPGELGAAAHTDPALSLSTLDARMEIWSRAIYGIQDFPYTGMGMNTFRRVVQVLYPLFRIGPDIDIGHAHNEFLQVALDLGIPGLIAFISLYLTAFGMLWRSWRTLKQNPDAAALFRIPGRLEPSPRLIQAVVLGLGGGLFTHLVYGMLDAVALGAKPGILFWMLLGLIAGTYNRLFPPLPQNPS